MMNSAFNIMNSVFKIMNSVFEMMIFASEMMMFVRTHRNQKMTMLLKNSYRNIRRLVSVSKSSGSGKFKSDLIEFSNGFWFGFVTVFHRFVTVLVRQVFIWRTLY